MNSRCSWIASTPHSRQRTLPAFERPQLQIGLVFLFVCFVYLFTENFFFYYITLHLIIFYENKIILIRSILHSNSHKKKIIYNVQISTLHPPCVKSSTGGWETDSLRQLPSLPTWSLESSFSVSLLLWRDENIISLLYRI